MKKYCLIIDTSAYSDDKGNLYVFDSDTVQGCKNKLAELNLRFDHEASNNHVYCAEINKKLPGRGHNRYQPYLRMGGALWFRNKPPIGSIWSVCDPSGWKRIDQWYDIAKFQRVA